MLLGTRDGRLLRGDGNVLYLNFGSYRTIFIHQSKFTELYTKRVNYTERKLILNQPDFEKMIELTFIKQFITLNAMSQN